MSTERFRAFAIAFAAVSSIYYVISLDQSWPLFTFWPASGHVTFYNHPDTIPGPELDWYGTVVSVLIVGGLAGLLAAAVPGLAGRLSPKLVWLVPLIAFILLFYLDYTGL
jgi:hypothetical protein